MSERWQRYLSIAIRSWILSVTVLFAPQLYALGLGEIQLQSHLGERLKAKIPVTSLRGDELADAKVRLASPADYEKHGLQYPHGTQFQFRLNQEDPPYILLTTSQTLNALFVDLLVELDSPSGKIVKAYTFLLDPPQLEIEAPGIMGGNNAVSPKAIKSVAVSGNNRTPPQAKPAVTVKKSLPAKKKRVSSKFGTTAKPVSEDSSGDAQFRTTPHGKLALSLSTALSISRSDPSRQSRATDMRDALQEDLIAKEKTLDELHLQIAEMQGVINSLQEQLATRATPVAATPVMAVESQQATVNSQTDFIGEYWRVLVGAACLLLLLCAVYLYRRRRDDAEHWDIFETPEVHEASGEPPDPAAVAPGHFEPTRIIKPEVGTQSIKIPAYVEPGKTPDVPPEYDLLEEADIYLRFGHDALAEEVLREAIKINPSNPHGYLTLLGVYDTRGDAKTFGQLAEKLKEFADESDWKSVSEMGKKLDADNPLYNP